MIYDSSNANERERLRERERGALSREMELKVYAHRVSQPSRAIIIFCKVNGIEFEEVPVDLMKGEHKSLDYKEINPMGQVPAIVHGTFSLFESHAILSYLACAFPGVADHWYPADLVKRAKINSILDWHHTNLRRGSATLVRLVKLAPLFGETVKVEQVKESEEILNSALSVIDSVWLQGNADFLLGNSQPSIADLSLACELTQLELLDDEHRERILAPYGNTVKWIENVKKATSPHFEEVHEVLFNFKASISSAKV